MQPASITALVPALRAPAQPGTRTPELATDKLADLRQRHPRWRIWAGDAGWIYATRAGLTAPGTGVTVHGKTPQALADAIQQAEMNAAERRKPS